MAKPIVVIGSSNVDLIMQVERLPQPGETVTNGVFSQVFGGKGANQAVAAARAGGNVHFITCLGDDDFGGRLELALREEGLKLDHLCHADGIATGTALILVDRAGRNSIAVAPGANHHLFPAHIDQAEDLLRQAALIVLQGELHPQTLDYILTRADLLGRPVMLNLAPAFPLSPAQLGRLQWLVLNESEAELLAGMPVFNPAAARTAANRLREWVGGGIILTMGAQGALVTHGSQQYLVPAFTVEPVDTTAAGDAFCGALAVGLVEGMLVDEAVHFASAAGAIAVTRLGAQPSIPRREEIEGFLTAERG